MRSKPVQAGASPPEVVVKLPGSLRERLQEVASREHRSITGQITKFVIEGLAKAEQSKASA